MLSNAISAGKSARDLILKSPEQMAAELNIHLRTGTTAFEIDRENRLLITDGGLVAYDELVLALGAEQIKPNLKGNAVQDLAYINHLDHFKKFQKKLSGKKKILILGGGLIGCEFANDLSSAGHHVQVVDMAASPLHRQLPEAVGSQLEKALSDLGTQWHLEKTVKSMDRFGDVYRCSMSDGGVLEADLVLSAIGLIPNIELAKQSGLEVNRGIVVDDYLRTNDPHIYAIGDCSEHDKKLQPFILPITYGSRALAETLCGQDTIVQYPLMPIVVKTPALPVCMLPAPESLQGEWVVETRGESTEAKYLDVHGQLQGFILMGKAVAQKNAYLEVMQRSDKCA
jgi:rubredoxin-NAD+ reductase